MIPNKNIFFIRHGEATHNIDFKIVGEKAYTNKLNIDSDLTQKGYTDACNLGLNSRNFFLNIFKKNNYIILVSPLKRTIKTAFLIFSEFNIPKEKFLSLDCIKEFPCGLHTVNKRMSKKTLEFFYGNFIDFSNLKNDIDEDWKDTLETENDLQIRINQLNFFLDNLKESNIIIVSHNSFIAKYLFNDTNYKIEHCKIYEK